MQSKIEKALLDKGIKLTEQRKIIAKVLSEANDHPDVIELHKRASAIDNKIGMATIYRTVKILEEANVIERHDFGDGRSRYEESPDDHHDHLINLKTGEVIEFNHDEIERLQEEIAKKLGYKLVGHKLELYGVPLDSEI